MYKHYELDNVLLAVTVEPRLLVNTDLGRGLLIGVYSMNNGSVVLC